MDMEYTPKQKDIVISPQAMAIFVITLYWIIRAFIWEIINYIIFVPIIWFFLLAYLYSLYEWYKKYKERTTRVY